MNELVDDAQINDIISMINEAKINTISSKDGLFYGVHFEATRAVLFKGPVFSEPNPDNNELAFSPLIEISSIVLNGGGPDIVFKKQSDLEAIYDNLVCTAIHTVKPENIATFLGRKLHGCYQGDMGNNFNIRIEGSRIKHHMGSAAIKIYDKHGLILRIETTANDISFFKHYREVVQRDGTTTRKYAHMRKNIYSPRPSLS